MSWTFRCNSGSLPFINYCIDFVFLCTGELLTKAAYAHEFVHSKVNEFGIFQVSLCIKYGQPRLSAQSFLYSPFVTIRKHTGIVTHRNLTAGTETKLRVRHLWWNTFAMKCMKYNLVIFACVVSVFLPTIFFCKFKIKCIMKIIGESWFRHKKNICMQIFTYNFVHAHWVNKTLFYGTTDLTLYLCILGWNKIKYFNKKTTPLTSSDFFTAGEHHHRCILKHKILSI